MPFLSKLRLLIAGGFLMLGSGAALAAFPEKPITLVVTYSAGGEADVQMRIVARHMEKEFGVPFVIKNVVGAGGQAGWDDIARGSKDGYTWVNYNLPQVVIQPAVRKTTFTLDGLEPLILFRDDPSVLAVRLDDPITLKEIVEKAQKEPAKVPVAVTGKWTQHHLSFLFLEASAKAKFGEVNVDGQAEVTRLLLGGHVVAGFGNSSAFYRLDKQARTIAVAAKKRVATMPNVPTFEELGYKGVLSSVIMGLAVAKGTDPKIIDDVSARLARMFATNDALKKDLETAGAPPVVLNRAQALELVAESKGPILEAVKKQGVQTR